MLCLEKRPALDRLLTPAIDLQIFFFEPQHQLTADVAGGAGD